jgi:hypothetical protein
MLSEGIQLDSHDLCVACDFLIGGSILVANRNALLAEMAGKQMHQPTRAQDTTECPRLAALKLGVMIGVFTMMHGAGHFALGRVIDEPDLMAGVSLSTEGSVSPSSAISRHQRLCLQLRPAKLLGEGKPLLLVTYFLSVTSFLAIAPFIGFLNGVPAWICVMLHVASSWCYISYVPTQFAFGFIQLILNLWYCIPRSILIGYSKEQVSTHDHDSTTTIAQPR